MDKGFPKPVEEVFPGMTGKVTAAFQYRGIKGFTIQYHKRKKTVVKSHLTLSFIIFCRFKLPLQWIKDA